MRYCSCRQRTMRGASPSPLAAVALLIAGLDVSSATNAITRYCNGRSAFAGVGASSRYNAVQPSAAFAMQPGHRKRPRQYESPFISLDAFPTHPSRHMPLFHQIFHRSMVSTTTPLYAKPKSGSIVDSYQTVSVNCSKCRTRLFRYKKKNGTKSNLIKCYIERISEDTAGIVESIDGADGSREDDGKALEGQEWSCPDCGQRFGRRTLIHGRPAIKLMGGKVRMTKK